MQHKRMHRPATRQHLRHGLHQACVPHAQQPSLRAGWIAQRPNGVEDGGTNDRLAGRNGMGGTRMMARRHAETEAMPIQMVGLGLRRGAQINAERFQCLCASEAGSRSVAVFGHRCASGRNQQRGERACIEHLGCTTGSTGIHDAIGCRARGNPHGVRHERLGAAKQFVGGGRACREQAQPLGQ